ncbi:hypothetical protein NHF46_03610 [Arthrobacter alpinus]|nr:hypothetical protein [Arthrobacter alpinus]
MLAVLEIYMTLGSIACLVSLFNDKSKRLGDMLAGTYAIRDRAPKATPLQVSVAPELAQWATLVDIGRLPDPLARRISMFLRQGQAMAGNSRYAMAVELASEASAYVAPLPAPGTDPSVFSQPSSPSAAIANTSAWALPRTAQLQYAASWSVTAWAESNFLAASHLAVFSC